MGLLTKLFGIHPTPNKPYVDAGYLLTQRLVASLGLNDWQNGRPIYTQEEEAAIKREFHDFQSTANGSAGSQMQFNPEVAENDTAWIDCGWPENFGG